MRRWAVLGAAGAAIVLGALAWHDSTRLRITHVRLADHPVARVLHGKTALLLSDVHLAAGKSRLRQRLLRTIRQLHPDLILLTGDYVVWYGSRADYDQVWQFLRALEAPLGVFAVMGDADYSFARQSCRFCHEPPAFTRRDLGSVRFLRDELVEITVAGQVLRIAGVDCRADLQPPADVTRALVGGTPCILLSHTSVVYADIDPGAPVLVLSGDTHGGQIRLPRVFWQVTARKPDPAHIYGLFRDGQKVLYVTSGAGTSSIPIRLGVPAEVVLLEFGEGEGK